MPEHLDEAAGVLDRIEPMDERRAGPPRTVTRPGVHTHQVRLLQPQTADAEPLTVDAPNHTQLVRKLSDVAFEPALPRWQVHGAPPCIADDRAQVDRSRVCAPCRADLLESRAALDAQDRS